MIMEWISVKYKLPDEDTIVMTWGYGCANCDYKYCQAYYSNEGWQELDSCGDFFDYPPTHWMPLPDRPKK